MAIRARIKRKLKKILGREETTNTNFTPPPVKKPELTPVNPSTTVPTPVELEEAQEEEVAEQPKTENTQEVEEVLEEVAEEQTEESAPSEEPKEEDTTQAEDVKETASEDHSGASFIIEISKLFPETCPNCDSPSHGNWGRRENAFICTSCDEEY